MTVDPEPSGALDPGKVLALQCMSWPARHARHSPQVISGWRVTVSPTRGLEPTLELAATERAVRVELDDLAASATPGVHQGATSDQ